MLLVGIILLPDIVIGKIYRDGSVYYSSVQNNPTFHIKSDSSYDVRENLIAYEFAVFEEFKQIKSGDTDWYDNNINDLEIKMQENSGDSNSPYWSDD